MTTRHTDYLVMTRAEGVMYQDHGYWTEHPSLRDAQGLMARLDDGELWRRTRTYSPDTSLTSEVMRKVQPKAT